jgi:hypothetical protein
MTIEVSSLNGDHDDNDNNDDDDDDHDDDDDDDHGARSAKKAREEVVTPLVELSQATVVHQLLQQGHSVVNINGIVAQNGTTTLQVSLRQNESSLSSCEC